MRRSRKAAIGSFVGAIVDWYDFLLYGFIAAIVFNTQFFPSQDPTVGMLAAFATFGVGFLFRPLGGIIFGHYGDQFGRKHHAGDHRQHDGAGLRGHRPAADLCQASAGTPR